MDTSERIYAVRGLMPGLVSLGEAPYELDVYKSICRSLGWTIDLEDVSPDTFFGAWFRDPNFLFKVTIDQDEFAAELAICAVDETEEQADFYVESRIELDAAFLRALEIACDLKGQLDMAGKFQRTSASPSYHFAYWCSLLPFLS